MDIELTQEQTEMWDILTALPEIDNEGNKIWRNKKGKKHRIGGPAIIFANGCEKWYQNGKLHRVGGPSIIRPNGTECWHQHGEIHRDDGPAFTEKNGNRHWYQHGEIRRTLTSAGKECWYEKVS